MIRVPRLRGNKERACYALSANALTGTDDAVVRVPPGTYRDEEIPNPREVGGEPWRVVVIRRNRRELTVGQSTSAWQAHGARVLS